MEIAKLVGTWMLVSFVIKDLNGVVEDWGKDLHGLLIYTASGSMSVGINKEVESSGSEASADKVLDSILFYSGTFEVQDDKIIHHVRVASDPDRIGKEMIRFGRLDRDLLILTSPQQAFGQAVLTWKRVPE